MKVGILSLPLILATCGAALAGGTCLPNAVPLEQRKNLRNAEGKSFPLSVLLHTWPSALLTSAVYEILIQEVMGYALTVYPRRAALTTEAYYALIGCTDFLSTSADKGCTNRTYEIHMVVDSWWAGFSSAFDVLKATFGSETFPITQGFMGYSGQSSLYFRAAEQEAAMEDGVAIKYFKSWNASWYQPTSYFSNITAVSTSQLGRCNSTGHFNDHSIWSAYLKFSGDLGGIVNASGQLSARCEDGFWWKGPACRSADETCVPCFLDESTIGLNEATLTSALLQSSRLFDVTLTKQ